MIAAFIAIIVAAYIYTVTVSSTLILANIFMASISIARANAGTTGRMVKHLRRDPPCIHTRVLLFVQVIDIRVGVFLMKVVMGHRMRGQVLPAELRFLDAQLEGAVFDVVDHFAASRFLQSPHPIVGATSAR